MRALTFLVIFLSGFHVSYAQISADFFSSNTQACGSLQTTFIDQSVSDKSIISWNWTLGGNTSNKQNPGAIFTEPGRYTICLTVTDVEGKQDTHCKEDYIIVLPNPVAAFTTDVKDGCAPVKVEFVDSSFSENGPITSWLWGLGGSTGVLNTQNPNETITSTYTSGGSYTISLTVEDSLGCSTTTSFANYISVNQIPSPEIQYTLLSSCQLPIQVQFTNANIDPSVEYLWDFGNGVTHAGPTPPTIAYESFGNFTLRLYMASGECRDTLLLEDYINTNVSADFSLSEGPFCQKEPIQFTDQTIVPADSVLWIFGDGDQTNTINPSHSYQNAGCYEVTLIRYSSACTDTFTFSCIEVSPIPTVNVEVENQFNCSLPTTITLNGNTEGEGAYSWIFEDGSNSTIIDSNQATIVIEEYGDYLVHFTFTDTLGCKNIQDSIPVDIHPFEVNLPSVGPKGCVPLSFTLQDSILSQVDIDSWEWTIGNPPLFTSSQSSPTFTIQDTGKYDVQLIAQNVNGCIDTITLENYIQVGMLPEVNFEATPIESCVGFPKEFFDLSSDFVNEWEWIFGTTPFSNEQNPLFGFANPGTYDVTLIASHNGCSQSKTIENYLTILAPISRFDVVYNCDDPYTVDIQNQSLGADSLFWTIRLSPTDSILLSDSLLTPFTFPDRGVYTISHYAKNFETGCEHTFTDTVKIVDPVASYTLDTLRGCAPLEIHLGDYSQDAFSYEYLSNEGTIDSIFTAEPTITFTEGGILNGPLLIITDIHECKDSFQLMDSVIVNKLIADIDFPTTICIPDEVDLLDQSTDVLGTPIFWQWELGDDFFASNDQNIYLLIDSVGSYDLAFKIIDDWGCKDSLFIPDAIQSVEVIPDFTSDTLGCTGIDISFQALGDNGFIDSYLWDFGDGMQSTKANPKHIYTNEGVYTVCLTMGDSRGCSKSICKEEAIKIIDPKAEFIGDPIFATCPPLLSTFTNLSSNTSSYIWDFGDNSGRSENTSPSHVYTSPGSYDVLLIAQSTSKCRDTLLLEDYVRVEGPSGAFTFEVSPTCIPISVELFAQSDGYYAYTWDYGNGILDSVAGLVIADTSGYIYNETGRFTPKLIITDSVGCSRSFAGDPIIVNDVELAFTKDSEPLCGPPLDVALQNNSEGTTDQVVYRWHINGPEIHNSTLDNPTFNITETGFYDVQLIAEYDNCIDTLSKNDYLEIADIPEVRFELETNELCENVNAVFTNTSQVEYGEIIEWQWDFGDGNSSSLQNPIHQFSGLESRTVTLIGTTDKGCTSEFSLTFDILPSMIGNAGEDELICIGDEVQLEGSVENLLDGGSFYWEIDTTLSCLDCLRPTANPSFTNSYIFVTRHPNGCESRDTVEVEVIPIPGPELSLANDSIICLGDVSTINVLDFDENYTYSWNEDVLGQDCYENCASVNVSPDSTTTYYVTVFNEFGCYESDSVTIEVETSIDEFIPPFRAICEGESTLITIEAGNNPEWRYDEDISCLTCDSIWVSPTKNKKYYLEVASDLGCKYLDSIQVIIVPEKSVSAGSDQEICAGEEISLFASGFGAPSWVPGNIVIDPNGFITTAFPDTSMYIRLIMTQDECIQEDSFYVTVYEQAQVVATGDSICAGQIGTLHAEGRADSYQWFTEDHLLGETSSINVSADTSIAAYVVGYYKTCIPDTAQTSLFVYPKVDYNLQTTDYLIHLNDVIQIQPEIDTARQYSYVWYPETGLSCVDCPDPTIEGITQNTIYTLLILNEENGCLEEVEINVRFRNECTQSVFHMPNIFSPRSTNENNSFKVYTNNPEEFISMSVYDRWGNFVFYSENINEGWNGMMSNHWAAAGVYVYKLELICPSTNENYTILGDVTVIY